MERDIIDKIKKHLDSDQISLLIGARQVGKTTILEQIAKYLEKTGQDNYFITLEDPLYLNELNKHPKNLLQLLPTLNKDKIYVLIDEIQYLENPSNFLKLIYDLYKNKIKLIVTGSSSFYIDKKFKDSLAGRKRIFILGTMDFKEMLRFKGYEKFSKYVKKGTIPKIYQKEISALLSEYIIYGGYPRVVLENSFQEKSLHLEDIAESYVKKDAIDADLHKTDNYLKILSILSKQTGSILNYTSLGNSLGISKITVQKYIQVMIKSFHLSLVPTFSTNKTKELTKSPKIYFNDLGLLNYFRNNFTPLPVNNDKGALFENYIFRNFLDTYGIKNIKYWRTQKKQEIDFIIDIGNGTQKAYEIKYSKKKTKSKKYEYFRQCYPQILLEFIDYESILG